MMVLLPRTALVGAIGLMALAGCEGDSTEFTEARLLTPAESNCILAAETQIGRSGITVADVETSEALTSVYLNVPEAEAEWLCRATPNGQVEDIQYTGAEGAL